MEAPPEGYRRNVGICLINNHKKFFAASRLDIPNSWQMPQGGTDEGEDPRNAAIRELREETGVSSTELIAEFLFKFTGQDQEINLLGDCTEKPEFGEWSWISAEQAVDFTKFVYILHAWRFMDKHCPKGEYDLVKWAQPHLEEI